MTNSVVSYLVLSQSLRNQLSLFLQFKYGIHQPGVQPCISCQELHVLAFTVISKLLSCMHALSPSPSLNLDTKSNSFHEFAVCRAFAESLAVKADGSGEWERRLLMQQNGANLLLVTRLNLSGCLNIYVARGRVGGWVGVRNCCT